MIDDLKAQLVAAQRLIGALRDDLNRFVGSGGDVTICEGCGAPIDHDEDAATTGDVQGCWGYVADVKDAPCYRYRTKAGVERTWPECALASAPAEAEAMLARDDLATKARAVLRLIHPDLCETLLYEAMAELAAAVAKDPA